MSNIEDNRTTEAAELAKCVNRCMQGERLNIDAIRNYLVRASMAATVGVGMLKPLPTYEQMLLQREPKNVELLMAHSDPDAVTAYDELINAFNADIERIKREDDREAIKRFVEKAQAISKGSEGQ